MVITIHNTLYISGLSSDTKPTQVPTGCVFWELDSGKVYRMWGGQWGQIAAGTGVWSPSQAETLTNKKIVLNQNDIETTSGANGLFGFNNAVFDFVPIGSAGLFLKVNATGDGFEFADPAVSGSWNPDATEEITNKTINAQLNTIKQTTPASGSLLLDNGTKFLPLAKGANNTFLGVNESGVVGYYEVQGGAGGNNYYYNALPSQSDQLWGWWHPLSLTSGGHGILKDNFRIASNGTTNTVTNDNTRGRKLVISMNATGDDGGIRCDTGKLWRRNYDSYMKFKYRISVVTTYAIWFGFTSDTVADYDSNAELASMDGFMFAKEENDSTIGIISNDGSSNQTKHPNLSMARDTLLHTVELCADNANNRFGYRIDDENGTWNYITTNLPRSNIDMGIVCNVGSETSSNFDYEMFLLETYNKLMV